MAVGYKPEISFAAPVGNVNASTNPAVVNIPAPSTLAIGDYYIVGVVYQGLYGNGNEVTPSGFVLLTPIGTNNNRLMPIYGKAIRNQSDLNSVASTPLRAGGTVTRIAAIGISATGVDLDASTSASTWVINNSSNSGHTFATHNNDGIFNFTYSNNSANTGHPTHSSVGGSKIGQVIVYSQANPSGASDTIISTMFGGTGVSFSPNVTNSATISVGLKAYVPPPPVTSYEEGLIVRNGAYRTADLMGIKSDTSIRQFTIPEYRPRTWVVSDIEKTNPFYLAHRGSGDNWPEHTMLSYTNSYKHGMKVLEVSCHRTSDGIFICHHDLTTTKMTGQNYTIATTPYSTIQTLTNTASYTDLPGQARQPIPLLTDVLNAYADKAVIFIEPKAGNDAIACLNLMDTYPDSTNHFVWKQWAGSNAGRTQARARGYKTWGYIGGSEVNRLEEWGPFFDYLGIYHGSTDAQVAEVVAYGNANNKPVIMWEIHTKADRDRAVSLGVSGMMTSNIKLVGTGPQENFN